jgi:hypothetical protein
MDIYFTDPSDVPLPPDEIRIRKFAAEPYTDGRRVRITIEVSPFQERPSGEVTIQDEDGNQVASASIIEAIESNIEITLHMRSADPQGTYTASTYIYYVDDLDVEVGGDNPPNRPQVTVIDRAETSFELSP